jgi:hypothetical protein
MPVSIMGGRSTGKSVFVALLLNTAISYGTKMNQHFRVYMDPSTNRVVGEMLKSLKKSLWPPATIKGSILEYRFTFGYSNHLQRMLLGIKEARLLPISREELFDAITFRLIDIAGEDVEMLSKFIEEAKKSGILPSEYISPSLKYALDSDVIVFLVDSEKITDDRNDKRYEEMVNYDILMSQLYSFLAMYRESKHEKKRNPIFPIFVLTKFDAIDPSIRRGLGIPDDFTHWVEKLSLDRNLRWKFFHNFMNKFYRQSLSQIYGVILRRAGIELEEAPIFISYVQTELNEEGILVPKVVKREHAIEVVYSETEYEAFIRYFGKIAKNISDRKVGAEEKYADTISAD